ncbi:restriction alleviation protein, Lar family [Ralstonia sp. TCR112]|uniref:Lar family restriction alleviation protein n=1 Tax=Ralstonia sp. TCR112 TaxID=2601730 RepID=UPI0011BDA90D|nr:Lar family restriction alleviation protein [Ralstonia sp. TCR112]TXD63487.1 restriction alleviation protein, Lar family [Ralstonia sp. TCR112]
MSATEVPKESTLNPPAGSTELEKLRGLIADDGFAATFQTMGRYRTALLQIASALARRPSSIAVSETLKECPFCGDDMSNFVPARDGFTQGPGMHYVECDCGASGAGAKTVAEAISAWNTRAQRSVDGVATALLQANPIPAEDPTANAEPVVTDHSVDVDEMVQQQTALVQAEGGEL